MSRELIDCLITIIALSVAYVGMSNKRLLSENEEVCFPP
jgi:hypothetical protein